MKVYCKGKLTLVSSLKPHPENPNTHTDEQIDLLAKVLKGNGWRQPVVVSKQSGFINTGHARVLAAMKNGWKKVPVDLQTFTCDSDELANMVADNAIAELSITNDDKIKDIALSIGPDDFDFERFGIPDFKIGGVDTLPPKKQIKKECPECGHEW